MNAKTTGIIVKRAIIVMHGRSRAEIDMKGDVQVGVWTPSAYCASEAKDIPDLILCLESLLRAIETEKEVEKKLKKTA